MKSDPSAETPEQNGKFSLAAVLANLFVTSKLTQLFILACLLLGLLALAFTPREDNPQIVVPGANIRVELPGASAEEVEQLVLRPLESGIKQIPAIDKVYGTAINSAALLSVQFEVGEDQEKALVKLHDRIGEVRTRLPPAAGEPFIRGMNVDDVPIVTVTLASATYDDYALKRLADRLRDGLQSLRSVSATEVLGGRDREVRVELDPDRLQAFGVTLEQVRTLLVATDVAMPLGTVVQQRQNRPVFLSGFLGSVEDARRLVVGVHAGYPVYLEDVATITDGPAEERKALSRLGFGPADPRYGHSAQPDLPAVTLAVAKQRGSNAVQVAGEVLARIRQMQADFIPAGVELVVTRNDGQIADDTVNGLIEHLGIAVLAVFGVTLLFLGRREALIVGMSVPLVLALTLGIAWMAGLSINRVSLFALILSLGLLVDDAIVVIENIHRRYAMSDMGDKREVTIAAAREVGNPTNLATLAVMLVFGSLLAVTGMSGEYFYPLAFSVPVAMASSLMVAYTVVPWAAHRWLTPGETHTAAPDTSISGGASMHRRYHDFLSTLLDSRRRRWTAIGVVVGLVLLSLLMPGWQFMRPQGVGGPQSWFGVEVSMMPQNNKNTFNITLDLPETTPLEETDRVARALCEVLRRHPQVSDYQLWLGQSGVIDFNGLLRGASEKMGPHIAEIRVNLRPKDQRDQTSMEIVRELRPRLQAAARIVPGAVVQLLEDPPGPPVRSTVLAEIYGPDPARLRTIANRVEQEFAQTWDMAEINTSEPADQIRQELVVDREKAAMSGLTTAEVATALRRLLDGEILGRIHPVAEKNPVPIRLLVPRRDQPDLALLSRAYISNTQGARVPLSELVTVREIPADRPILHKNGERVTYVMGEMRQMAPAYAVLDLDRRLDGLPLPDGSHLQTGNLRFTPQAVDGRSRYTLLWDGAQRQMLDAYRDMLGALGISIVLIFLILVAYYQSFSLPVVAMAAIPLGLAGVFPGHWLMQSQFSATSMIGVIALAGVVVRNSLLIIDFVLDYRSQGRPLREAVLEAGAVRLRPILLTALAIVLGSAIMLTDPLFSGLAISLIFGTVAATVLTLVVIPLLLWRLLRTKELGNL